MEIQGSRLQGTKQTLTPSPKNGTYIYHRIDNFMGIKNIPYVGGLRQLGPPQGVSKYGTRRDFSKSPGLSAVSISIDFGSILVPRHIGM